MLKHGPKPKGLKKPGRKKQYQGAVVEALTRIWEICGRICSKRLKPSLPEMVTVLEHHQELVLVQAVKSQPLQMSRATIDRCLKPARYLFRSNPEPGMNGSANGIYPAGCRLRGDPVWETRPCGAPLFEYSETRRWSIAEYIKDKAHGRFKILIGDECHEYKSKSRDRGVAFHQLAEATQYTLTLTGTYFGGKSTSIFWLLHRLTPGVRQDFTFHDELRWAGAYGVLESVRKRRASDESSEEDGTFTGNRRYREQAREIPGVSPAIITRLLHNSIFLNLKDLGVELPPYTEEVVELDMDSSHGRQYRRMESILRHMARRDQRYLSLWLQWALSRPNSAFRDEIVAANHASVQVNVLEALAREMLENATTEDPLETHAAQTLLEAARLAQSAAARREKETLVKVPLMPLEAVVDRFGLLPKESWLSSFCKAEKTRGRRTLVYVRQTGTRDIQDRLENVLKQSGVQAITLYGSVNPRRRERWIEDHGYVDALITNPRLVQTGLDLVSFHTVVFYEPEYSFYTLWQALRRVWRLGQTRPVKAVFAVYKNAMEAQALALMGRKMRAAQTLYGDEVGGAIVPVEEGDFITELAREMLRGADIQAWVTIPPVIFTWYEQIQDPPTCESSNSGNRGCPGPASRMTTIGNRPWKAIRLMKWSTVKSIASSKYRFFQSQSPKSRRRLR